MQVRLRLHRMSLQQVMDGQDPLEGEYRHPMAGELIRFLAIADSIQVLILQEVVRS